LGERIRRLGHRAAVVAFLLAGAYYAVFGGVYDVFDIQSMEASRAELVEGVDSLVSLTDSLVQRGDSLVADADAIERVAREEYGFVRDGEILVRFVKPARVDD
jgi:cell division protein FtsB